MAKEKIIVRWIETGRIQSRHHAAFAAVLDDEERSRAGRFRFKEDEVMFTAAHALARCTLSEINGRPPHSWTFRIGPYGKPAAARPGAKLIKPHQPFDGMQATLEAFLEHIIPDTACAVGPV